jgi:hypothetical protein
MANNSLRQLSDALNMATAQLSGDPQRMQMALGMQQSRKLQEQENKLNQWIGENVPEDQQQLLYAVPFAERAKILMGSQTDKSTFERFDVYDKKTGQRVGSINKADANKIDTEEFSLGPFSSGFEKKDKKVFQVIDANNNRVPGGIVTLSEFEERQKSGEYPKSHTIVDIPTLQQAPKLTDIQLFSDTNKPYAARWEATDLLLNNLQGYADQLSKSDAAALTGVGSAANFVNGLIQNTTEFLDFASNETQSFYSNSIQNNDYKTVGGKDFSERVKEVSNQFGINESRVRDLAYLFAAARGQEGRGLSDKDYENALRIVSGGVGAEGKIAVIEDTYNRLKGEVSGAVDKRIKLLESPEQRNLYPDRTKFFDIEVGQLRSLQQATPFGSFLNPLTQQAPSTTSTPKRIRRPLNP